MSEHVVVVVSREEQDWFQLKSALALYFTAVEQVEQHGRPFGLTPPSPSTRRQRAYWASLYHSDGRGLIYVPRDSEGGDK
jgi:hypothetical protein